MTVTTLRRKARGALDLGDRTAVLQFLNAALATQLVCVLRFRRHHFMARALAHADLIAERIVQLGGEPDFAPGTLCERSQSGYVAANTVVEMLRDNLGAARLAVDKLPRPDRSPGRVRSPHPPDARGHSRRPGSARG